MIGVRPRPTFERKLEWTQPRFRRADTSHHRQPLVQPNTRTDVPRGSQPTMGNVRSGPARMLTSLVVKAVCAPASNDSEQQHAGKRTAKASMDGELKASRHRLEAVSVAHLSTSAPFTQSRDAR